MTELIYYTSKNNIEKLFKEQFGPSYEEEITTSSGKNNSITPKIALSKLLGLFVDAGIEVSLATEKKKLRTLKYTDDFIDKAIKLITQIETSEHFKDILEFTQQQALPIYKFSLPLKVCERYKKTSEGTYIIVSHESESLKFETITSKDNWGSGSLINNLLHSCEVNKNAFYGKGLLVPINAISSSNQIILTCQILIIYG